MSIVGEDNHLFDNFRSDKDEKPTIKGLDIEEEDINLVSKSLNIESCIRDILSE